MEFDLSAVAQQRLQDTFCEGVSEAAKSLTLLASELDDDLLSHEIKELQTVVGKINYKVGLFHQVTTAKVERLGQFAKTYNLDPNLVKEGFNKISVIGPSQPAALQLVSILEVQPPLSYILLKLRSRLEAPLLPDEPAFTSLPSPSAESCTVTTEELYHQPNDGNLAGPIVEGNQSQGAQDECQPTITVQYGPPPQAVPPLIDDMPVSPIAAVPTRDRTPSLDRASALLQQVDDKTIESHKLTTSEFTFINVANMSSLYILRCPDPKCPKHHFEKHPFKWHRGVKHFDKFHPEVFAGEHPSEQFVFDNFALRVNGLTSLDVKARWKTKKCRVDLSKSKPYRREQVPSIGTKKRSSRPRRPISPSSESGSTILGADDEIPDPPRSFSDLQTSSIPPVDRRKEPSTRSPRGIPRNVEIHVLEDSSDDCDSDDSDENLDYLDSEFRPLRRSGASKTSCDKASNHPSLSQARESHEAVASSQSSPKLSRKRGRSLTNVDDEPQLIVTLKAPRLDAVRTERPESQSSKDPSPLPEEESAESSRQYSDPLPRRFARN